MKRKPGIKHSGFWGFEPDEFGKVYKHQNH